MLNHEIFMQRCLQLAALGQQYVAPNPMVGAVVVSNGKIIGEGYHKKHGEAHAEVNAINAVKDKSLLKGATIYVSLEPCAHFGKTPPCTGLIVENQISEVIVACLDPNPLVAGKGVEQLKQAGIKVLVGVLKEQAEELNKRFIHYHSFKKPYVVLKWAQTADNYSGRIPGADLSPKITNWYADILVHQLRSNESAILIGFNTAKYDNPLLSTRKWFGKNPLRIIIDLEGQLAPHLNIFTDKNQTVVFTLYPRQPSASVSFVQINNKHNLLDEILNYLYEQKINSLLVEGGPQTLQLFIDQKVWNEAHIFTSSNIWKQGVKAPQLNYGNVVQSIALLDNNYKIINSEK